MPPRRNGPGTRRDQPPTVCEGARLLRAWRIRHGVGQASLEASVSVSRHYCHQWEFGVRIPTLPHAAHIEVVTHGEVPVEAWGYTETDIAPLLAFAQRRGALSAPTPGVRGERTARAIILKAD